MHRRAIPEYAMNEAGSEHLRQRGVLVMRFMDSVHNDPRRLKPHFHEFFQMYLLQGNARLMLDFKEYSLHGMNAAFVSPGQVHTVKPGRELQGVTLSFTQAFFDDDAPPPSRLLELPFFFPDDSPPWLKLTSAAATGLTPLFDDLCAEYDAAKPDAEEMLRATLRLLLLRLGRLASQQQATPQKASRSMTLLRQFQLELEKHFRERTDLATYARALGVTANHLNDVVHEQTGHAAGDLIRRRRLLDAKRLLSHSDLSVSEIGYSLGFDDPSYFARFFRRYEKMTPTKFRDQIREKYQTTNQ